MIRALPLTSSSPACGAAKSDLHKHQHQRSLIMEKEMYLI